MAGIDYVAAFKLRALLFPVLVHRLCILGLEIGHVSPRTTVTGVEQWRVIGRLHLRWMRAVVVELVGA